ncbi:MAG TPA: phosphatidate cytidylyltransferase [Burkholderiales bacterium]|nr:phosphatidate cytidylyltransferase [Burkholderiales bacterium]
MPDFLRRAGTAAVLLAALVAALFLLPRAGIVALMALIAAAAALEWARLCALSAPLYAAGAVAALLLASWLEAAQPVFVLAAAFWLLAAPAWLWLGVRPGHRGALAAAGLIVLVPAALAMVVLEPAEALLVLAVAWIADTAAYVAGTRWGRRKLAPAISPGKTWEGAAGGLIGGAAYAMILSLILAGAQATRMAAFVGAAALLVTVSIVGDLFESAAKRQAGVKDSGALLPGHGGVLDRIDSAAAILPLAALVVPFLRSSP